MVYNASSFAIPMRTSSEVFNRMPNSPTQLYAETSVYFNTTSRLPLFILITKKSTGVVDSGVTLAASSTFGNSLKNLATA